ncbi:Domain of uncharacterised function (DUF2825) [Klebsiella pneumoniae]|nr:Domain of uncharacterised function (DUF2825) [Klebsiella pneumoniae]
MKSVYPRWRGEHVNLTGTPAPNGRFIPAGAGNTLEQAAKEVGEAVYPRWRGEHALKPFRRSQKLGLSPLARGTPDFGFAKDPNTRFIPAGAGNTWSPNKRPMTRPVYPRWRGEHVFQEYYQDNGVGLSPLARGTPFAGAETSTTRRFIPAGAGNTITAAPIRSNFSVYPRWRGEHHKALRPHYADRGLSPLARGTLVHTRNGPHFARFIPAGAGNTNAPPETSFIPSVYPRWRGEHGAKWGHMAHKTGLSPLARGTLIGKEQELERSRFIPAGAGNTQVLSSTTNYLTVYPRWRGEHALDNHFAIRDVGLSPLARGTRRH